MLINYLYNMKKQNLYGVWVDHAEAFICNYDGEEKISMKKIKSDVEGHHHSGINTNEHVTIANQHRHDNRRANELHGFLKEIIENIKDADEILVFGPSTAKYALEKELKKNKSLSLKLQEVDTADSMSENQMKAYVKEFFSK